MTKTELLERVDRLNVWKRRGERAPHKPLLLLLALGRLSLEHETLPFSQCERLLGDLLREFGPSRQSLHPEYPFWRLQNDRLWVVKSARGMSPRRSNSDPPKTELRRAEAVGALPEDVRRLLSRNPALVTEVARRLLEAHFPNSLHDDVLTAVGLSLSPATTFHPLRDPAFRRAVLTAYEHRCAVCGLDLRVGNLTAALEAAHIRWHQAGGPDVVFNGLALCSLHHKVFDLGAFTVSDDLRLLVSEQATGGHRFREVLMKHHGRQINSPVRSEDTPRAEFLTWHRREVFKERARPLPNFDGVGHRPTSP